MATGTAHLFTQGRDPCAILTFKNEIFLFTFFPAMDLIFLVQFLILVHTPYTSVITTVGHCTMLYYTHMYVHIYCTYIHTTSHTWQSKGSILVFNSTPFTRTFYNVCTTYCYNVIKIIYISELHC